MVKRFEIYLVNLDDAVTDDPKNTRPALVVSPDEMNRHLEYVLIAPVASTKTHYPTRVPIHFLNAERSVILDQLRTVESVRLVKKIGDADRRTQTSVLAKLNEMFAD